MSNKALVFLTGAAIGALAGILLAPEKGSETRKKISGKANDMANSVKDSFNGMADKIKSGFGQVAEEADELRDMAKAKMSAAKSTLS